MPSIRCFVLRQIFFITLFSLRLSSCRDGSLQQNKNFADFLTLACTREKKVAAKNKCTFFIASRIRKQASKFLCGSPKLKLYSNKPKWQTLLACSDNMPKCKVRPRAGCPKLTQQMDETRFSYFGQNKKGEREINVKRLGLPDSTGIRLKSTQGCDYLL